MAQTAGNEAAIVVVSGGQTGADRGALDAALALGLPCGGWCPRGRRAEDGPIPDRYPLRETPAADYPQRTEWNVRDSDGTLILHAGRVDRGTALTVRLAERYRRPLLVREAARTRPEEIRAWLAAHAIRRLNVAGPRESRSPGLQAAVETLLRAALAAGEEATSRER